MKASDERHPKGLRQRPAAWVAAAVGAALLLGACGSTATTTSNQPTGSTPGTVAPSTLRSTPSNPLGDAVEIRVVMSPYGPALGRGTGHVLYAWDKETDGSTICDDAACVEKWPPVIASAISFGADVPKDKFTLLERPDGTKQVAFDGRRLYTMAIDAPGEANCQGTEGWWILNPDGTKNERTTPIGSTTAPTTSTGKSTATTAYGY